MTNTNSIPYWYKDTKIIEELNQILSLEINKIGSIETLELRNIYYLSCVFQDKGFRKHMLDEANNIESILAFMLPKTVERCHYYIEKYEDKLKYNKFRFSSNPVTEEISYLLNLLQNIPKVVSFEHSNATINLSKMFNLSDIESEILNTVMDIFRSKYFYRVIDDDLTVNINDTCQFLSLICGFDRDSIKQCLSSDSALIRFGLLKFNSMSKSNSILQLETEEGLLETYFSENADKAWLSNFLAPAANKPKTKVEDYFYLKEEVASVQKILNAYTQGDLKKAPQILLWGKPGTGKTEFARLCGQLFFDSCYEVPFEDKAGKILNGMSRLQSYSRIGYLFKGQKTSSLIFDEMEDVIPHNTDDRNIKAMLNRAIEQPNMTVFWLTNSVSDMDESYLRRFDLILEFKALKADDAMSFFTHHSSTLDINPKWITTFCRQYQLAPSVILDTLDLVKAMSLKGTDAEKFIELKVDQFNETTTSIFERLTSSGKKSLGENTEKTELIPYDVKLSNTDIPLEQLTELLKEHNDTKLLCYGPPGTGKTAFSKYLGKSLGKEYEYINASELLNMFVGGTEKHIREIFNIAKYRDTIVVIDEIDSILRTREKANNTWEVTQVNQFLSSIEAFEGICIVCTNFESVLDPAIYRRFDLKIQFNYLQPCQSFALFKQLAKKLNIDISNQEETISERLSQEHHLVPAYFSLVARRARFLKINNDCHMLLKLLCEEQEWTKPKSRQVRLLH